MYRQIHRFSKNVEVEHLFLLTLARRKNEYHSFFDMI